MEMNGVVVNRTGLEGAYTFELRWTRSEQNAKGGDSATVDALPILADALHDTLGLRLQPQKVPVEVVVVDHLERSPTEN